MYLLRTLNLNFMNHVFFKYIFGQMTFGNVYQMSRVMKDVWIL